MSSHAREYCDPVPIHATVPTDSADVYSAAISSDGSSVQRSRTAREQVEVIFGIATVDHAHRHAVRQQRFGQARHSASTLGRPRGRVLEPHEELGLRGRMLDGFGRGRLRLRGGRASDGPGCDLRELLDELTASHGSFGRSTPHSGDTAPCRAS